MSRLLERLKHGPPILMDGAMGTMLWRAGLRVDENTVIWNATRPDAVRAVHRAYQQAGSECHLTNTFQVLPDCIVDPAWRRRWQELLQLGIALARESLTQDSFVLASIGPYRGDFDQKLWKDVAALAQGVDGLLLETFSDLTCFEDWKHSVAPVLGDAGIPLFVSISYLALSDGALTSRSGHTPSEFARIAQESGIVALGANCGKECGKQELARILAEYRSATDLPLFVRPNAGTPVEAGGECCFPWAAAEMATWVEGLIGAGAVMVGGCCGTTPDHVRLMGAALKACWDGNSALPRD